MPRQSSRIKQSLISHVSVSSRPRRTALGGSHAIVTREEIDNSDDSKPALRLTVKMPSSRLREATSAGADSEDVAPRIRSTRNKQRKSYALESDSDDEDEIEEDEDEDAEISEDSEGDGQANSIVPIGSARDYRHKDRSEEEDVELIADEDGDVDMEEDDEDADDGLPLGAPPPAPAPALKLKGSSPLQPKVTITPAQDTKLKSVEAREMEMDDDDEELSELGSEDEEDEEGDEDAAGEDVEGEEDGDEMDDGDESRSPDALGSRASTPDISKMTKRQRSRLDLVMGADFLQLPMEPQIKKHLTAEEHAMRRAEMARRRKNLSEKRNEEEKADTINRLLKKQAPKRRGKISHAEIAAQDRGDDDLVDDELGGEAEREEIRPANPVFTRWVSNSQGCRVGVPTEWLDGPLGKIFLGVGIAGGRKMVEEVEG